jgi:hypothetical protein
LHGKELERVERENACCDRDLAFIEIEKITIRVEILLAEGDDEGQIETYV